MSQPRPPWEQGTEPAPQVALLGVAVLLSVVAFQHLTAGRLGLFFDLSFVTVCMGLAARVRRDGFFTVGLLPPALMLAVLLLLAATSPGTVARESDTVVQAVVSGLAHHAEALVSGYTGALAVLFWRRREFLADMCEEDQSSKREVSPAPTRMISG